MKTVQIARTDLADEIAHKFLEGMSTEDLERFFFDHHFEYYQKAQDDELNEMARYTGIIDEDDTLHILEN